MIAPGLRKWLAFGSGVGISIEGPRGAEALHITLVRVRPSGTRTVDSLIVEDYHNRPAAEWGAEFNALLSKHGMQHVAATVLLPRHEVILRQISLPGVSDKDLDAAVSFQLDGLHPYNEAAWNDQVLKEPLALRTARAVNHARNTLMAGWTMVRDLGTEGAGYADVGLKQSIDQGIIPGPRMLVTTRAIVATGSYAPRRVDFAFEPAQGAQEANGPEDVIRVTREQIADALSHLDYASVGGAPLLGVRGGSIICHGKSSPLAIKNALKVARLAIDHDMSAHIGRSLRATPTGNGR